MKSRMKLQDKLMKYCEGVFKIPNGDDSTAWGFKFYPSTDLCKAVYFQPPENLKLEYPCIIYRRSIDKTLNANDENYFYMNQYELTVIEKNPVVPLAEAIIKDFHYASILNRYTIDNLYHTIIRLYY